MLSVIYLRLKMNPAGLPHRARTTVTELFMASRLKINGNDRMKQQIQYVSTMHDKDKTRSNHTPPIAGGHGHWTEQQPLGFSSLNHSGASLGTYWWRGCSISPGTYWSRCCGGAAAGTQLTAPGAAAYG